VTQELHVVVLDRSDALIQGLAKAVGALTDEPEVWVYEKHDEAAAVFAETGVAVLVVGPSELTQTGMRRVAKLHAKHPETVVVVAGRVAELPDPITLVKAGVSEVIKLPAGSAAIRRALQSALDLYEARRVEVTVEVPVEIEMLDENYENDENDAEAEGVTEPEPGLGGVPPLQLEPEPVPVEAQARVQVRHWDLYAVDLPQQRVHRQAGFSPRSGRPCAGSTLTRLCAAMTR